MYKNVQIFENNVSKVWTFGHSPGAFLALCAGLSLEIHPANSVDLLLDASTLKLSNQADWHEIPSDNSLCNLSCSALYFGDDQGEKSHEMRTR